jgi:hypothetical protein
MRGVGSFRLSFAAGAGWLRDNVATTMNEKVESILEAAGEILFGGNQYRSRDEDAEIEAKALKSRADLAGQQTEILRQRVKELERDNALLAVVLLQVLKLLETKGVFSRGEFSKSLRDELAKLRREKGGDFMNVFRREFGLPPQVRTDVVRKKPSVKRPVAPAKKTT